MDYVGIVDIRSSGRTLVYLNKYLVDKGFKSVRGYYFELFCGAADIQQDYYPSDYYVELSDRYDTKKAKMIESVSHMFESFFPLNTLQKTIGYTFVSNKPEPIFNSSEEENELDIDKVLIKDKSYWAPVHKKLIESYTDIYIQCGLCHYSDSIFEIANRTLFLFITEPNKIYLTALLCLYGKRWGTSFLPYVRKELWARLLISRGKDTMWKQGTLIYNDFIWFQKLYQKIRYNE